MILIGMYIPVSAYTEAVMTPQLGPPAQKYPCDPSHTIYLFGILCGISVLAYQSNFLNRVFS